MRTRPDCIPCLFSQALNTARHVTRDPETVLAVMRAVARYVHESASFACSPAVLSKPIYRIVSEITGEADPYAGLKSSTNRLALELLPAVEKFVESAPDPLEAALHAAAAGNVIDFGIAAHVNVERDVLPILKKPFAVNAVADFRAELGPGRRVLYLGDNAGEIVLDTLLVKQIQRTGTEVIFAVKSGPIINDATMADAEQAGMTRLAQVIETGAADIGTILPNCTAEFRRLFDSADAIVAKGHGNFETCNDLPANLYFLLKIKCAMVAEELSLPPGEIVFKHGHARTPGV
jgi:uncharacterized protein with ATP-grasp and redox domains